MSIPHTPDTSTPHTSSTSSSSGRERRARIALALGAAAAAAADADEAASLRDAAARFRLAPDDPRLAETLRADSCWDVPWWSPPVTVTLYRVADAGDGLPGVIPGAAPAWPGGRLPAHLAGGRDTVWDSEPCMTMMCLVRAVDAIGTDHEADAAELVEALLDDDDLPSSPLWCWLAHHPVCRVVAEADETFRRRLAEVQEIVARRDDDDDDDTDDTDDDESSSSAGEARP